MNGSHIGEFILMKEDRAYDFGFRCFEFSGQLGGMCGSFWLKMEAFLLIGFFFFLTLLGIISAYPMSHCAYEPFPVIYLTKS